jgi:hypothetical protein
LASGQLVPVGASDGVDRWTSRELLDIERRFIATVGSGPPGAALPPQSVETALVERPNLGDDQVASVRTITASTAPVAVLVGPAGTGKTFAIDAIRAAYQHAGWIAYGAAPSARAALELAAGANLRTSTLHSLLETWNRGLDTPRPRSLLVVDEAGMADIRTLETTVSRQITAGGRVLLVGDHHQLPEIGAGGGLEHAARHAACVTELSVNRRQQQAWERNALTELRAGRVAVAAAEYLAHDRVVVLPSPTEMITTAVERWLDAHDSGLRPVLLAGTNELVDRLNAAVIDRLVERGELTAETAPYGPAHYRVGQRIVLRRNSTAEHTLTGDMTAVANGQLGTVEAADQQRMIVALDEGPTVALDERYRRRGGDLAHAYALTTHRAQGGTWDLAIAVGADGLYREGAYVALSRGADENVIILTDPEAAELARQASLELARHDTGIVPPDELPPDVDTELTERLGRSGAKYLAHTLDPDVAAVDHLARQFGYTELVSLHLTAATAEHHATAYVGAERTMLVAERDRIETVARHLQLGLSVSPHDRNNVGTVVAIDDHAGTADVHFLSRHGHEATRRFGWSELRPIDQEPLERPLTTAAQLQLARLLEPIEQRIDEWDRIVQSHGVQPGEATLLRRAVSAHITRATARLVVEHPGWIEWYLGPRPTDPAGATTWNDAARTIATWRLDNELGADTAGIGPRPSDGRAAAWERLTHQLADTRIWLGATDRLDPTWRIAPSHDELTTRLQQLVEILDAAPADCRHLIAELRSGQLTFDDTHELLQTALAQQDARRAWIVEHWPHLIEHHEIVTMLEEQSWGPDPSLLTGLLAYTISDELAAAITRGDRWLRAALCEVAEPDSRDLTNAEIDILENIALRIADSAVSADVAITLAAALNAPVTPDVGHTKAHQLGL